MGERNSGFSHRIGVEILVEADRIETDDHFFCFARQNHQGWRFGAVVFFGHFAPCFGVGDDVALLECNPLGFKEDFHQLAGEAAGLGEEEDAGHDLCFREVPTLTSQKARR